MSLRLRCIEIILCFIVLVFFQYFPSRLDAAESAPLYKSYPLSVNLDSADNVKTSLHIKFRETEYNVLVKEFTPKFDEDTFLLKWLELGSRPKVEELRRIIKAPIEGRQEPLILNWLKRIYMEQRDYFKIFFWLGLRF